MIIVAAIICCLAMKFLIAPKLDGGAMRIAAEMFPFLVLYVGSVFYIFSTTVACAITVVALVAFGFVAKAFS